MRREKEDSNLEKDNWLYKRYIQSIYKTMGIILFTMGIGIT